MIDAAERSAFSRCSVADMQPAATTRSREGARGRESTEGKYRTGVSGPPPEGTGQSGPKSRGAPAEPLFPTAEVPEPRAALDIATSPKKGIALITPSAGGVSCCGGDLHAAEVESRAFRDELV